MVANSLTLTTHGLAMRINLASLQCGVCSMQRWKASQNFILANCTILEFIKLQIYYKWFEITVKLLVKAGKRLCGVYESYNVLCSHFSGFVLQGVNINQHQSRVLYLTASQIFTLATLKSCDFPVDSYKVVDSFTRCHPRSWLTSLILHCYFICLYINLWNVLAICSCKMYVYVCM